MKTTTVVLYPSRVSLCCPSFLCAVLKWSAWPWLQRQVDVLLSLDQRGQMKQDRLNLLKTAAGLTLFPLSWWLQKYGKRHLKLRKLVPV